MDFSLSPEHTQLRARVRALVDDVLQPIEDEAERNHGRLSAETHARIHQAVLDSGLGANNIPKEFGGGGFNLTEQIVTHEQLGRLTNCLWVLVWSPVERARPRDARADRALPAPRRPRRASPRLRHHRGRRRLRSRARSRPRRSGTASHYELSGVKWFVTDGDVASLLHRPRVGRRRQRAPARPCSSSTRTRPASR